MKTISTLILLSALTLTCSCAPGRKDLLSPFLRGSARPLLPPTRPIVTGLVDKLLAEKKADFISVYFQSLATGYWFGINEREEFMPASLLKLPLAMGIMMKAGSDPALLDTKLTLMTTDDLLIPEFLPAKRLIKGKQYTVETLIRHMLEYSDNEATQTLIGAFSTAQLDTVLSDFGLKAASNDQDFVTVKQYLMLLLSLYNATYLDIESSQHLLEMLTRSTFSEGIAGGLPRDVKLAHKFGEREMQYTDDNIKQLHECGIIYYKNSPYMLGVMTRGHDLRKQAEAIREISALVYSEVAARSEGK